MWIDFLHRLQASTVWLSPSGGKRRRGHHNGQLLLLIFTLLFTLTNANFLPKVEVMSSTKGGKVLENSPIFYLKIAGSSLRNSFASGGIKSQSVSPTTSLLLGGKRNSNLYKLPLNFVSNAKPVDIIQGIMGKKKKPQPYNPNKMKVTYSSVGSTIYKHSSKVFYLPTRFVSNGKPVKPILLASSTSNKKNNLGKRKFYQHHLSSTRLKYGAGGGQF